MISAEALIEQKEEIIKYLLFKIKVEDWHAVQDAASDIREIDAKLVILQELEDSR